jgi:hypothetical protein
MADIVLTATTLRSMIQMMENSEVVSAASTDHQMIDLPTVVTRETDDYELLQQMLLPTIGNMPQFFYGLLNEDDIDNMAPCELMFDTAAVVDEKSGVQNTPRTSFCDNENANHNSNIPVFVQNEQLDYNEGLINCDNIPQDQSWLASYPPSPCFHTTSHQSAVKTATVTSSSVSSYCSSLSAISTTSLPLKRFATMKPTSSQTILVADQTVPRRASFSPNHGFTVTGQDSGPSSPSTSVYSDQMDPTYGLTIKSERVSASRDSDLMDSVDEVFSPLSTGTTMNLGRNGSYPAHATSADDPLTIKKQRRKEQNRRAATKCRVKRRTEFETLKKNLDTVQRENDALKRQIIELQNRYDKAHGELARHCISCHLSTTITGL